MGLVGVSFVQELSLERHFKFPPAIVASIFLQLTTSRRRPGSARKIDLDDATIGPDLNFNRCVTAEALKADVSERGEPSKW
mmetsp:Transcript_60069/g.99720  ORF Transcript_60069/g.99720 Transcript_60069/m.99720 type:complete len:81 (-) Transcript_60069:3488-3730(-)